MWAELEELDRWIPVAERLPDEYQGVLCITISHDTKFVTRNFPRTMVLCQGKVIDQGPTEEVFTHVDVLKQSYVIPPPVARVSRAAGMRRVAFDVDGLVSSINEQRRG